MASCPVSPLAAAAAAAVVLAVHVSAVAVVTPGRPSPAGAVSVGAPPAAAPRSACAYTPAGGGGGGQYERESRRITSGPGHVFVAGHALHAAPACRDPLLVQWGARTHTHAHAHTPTSRGIQMGKQGDKYTHNCTDIFGRDVRHWKGKEQGKEGKREKEGTERWMSATEHNQKRGH